MADFCKQCSIDTFGEDYGDLAGITEKAEWEKGLAACTICEGCGPIQLNPAGECVSTDCMCKGQTGHGMSWFTSLVEGFKENEVTLSDEDYGILYNAISAAVDRDSAYLMDNLDSIREVLHWIGLPPGSKLQHALDFASFIILSEGRELP